MGEATRRYVNAGGQPVQKPEQSRWIRLRNSAERLPDDDLDHLYEAIKAERRRRQVR